MNNGYYLKIKSLLSSPTDLASLGIFRIFCGMVFFWEIVRYFKNGWIEKIYTVPFFHFKYWGFEWVNPLPGEGMKIIFLGLGICSLGLCLGLFYRASCLLFFLGFTYVFLSESCRYLNHFYMICLLSFLMIFLPAHRQFGLDPGKTKWGPAWALWTLRAQLFLVYFFGAIAKMNEDWLLRGEPIRSWLRREIHLPLVGPLFAQEWTVYFFAYGGLLLDLFIVPLLLWRKTRIYAFVLGTFFHLMNAHLFHIGIFPWFMIGANLLFFSPSWPRRFLSFFRREKELSPLPSRPSVYSLSSATLLLLMAYFSVQILLPLRHFLYPGNVNWTEEGHLFSWHMKLRVKKAYLEYTVWDPGKKKETVIYPEKILPYWQYRKMRSRPELILQFARFLEEKIERRNRSSIQIYAWTEASLHDREPQFLIDPEVDLTKVRSSLKPASWIIPLEE